jgi:hypothetical protein
MTAIDPFTTPAEAERAARTRQARDFLALAMRPEHVSTEGWDQLGGYRRNYSNGVQAMRDAMVGQGYALVAVQAELADIADSLRTLAALPAAVQRVGDSVTAAAETTDLGLSEIASAVRDVAQAVDDHTEARRRWWRRWLGRQSDDAGEVSP